MQDLAERLLRMIRTTLTGTGPAGALSLKEVQSLADLKVALDELVATGKFQKLLAML